MLQCSRSPRSLQRVEDYMDRLKGKVILISGGARRQGAAEARLFVAEGAQVVIGDVLEAEARRLEFELGLPRPSPAPRRSARSPSDMP